MSTVYFKKEQGFKPCPFSVSCSIHHISVRSVSSYVDKQLSCQSPTAPLNDTPFLPHHSTFMATKNGIVKKTPICEYANVRKTGLAAINLRDDDELIEVKKTDKLNDTPFLPHHSTTIFCFFILFPSIYSVHFFFSNYSITCTLTPTVFS
mgnify:CR=1 FL=1